MITKVICPKCNELHDVEIEIDLGNLPSNMGEDNEWTRGIFKCVVFKNPYESKEAPAEPTIKDAKTAMRALEQDFLNKIMDFEKKYGITIQYVETNLSGISMWDRGNDLRTNSVLVYGDL